MRPTVYRTARPLWAVLGAIVLDLAIDFALFYTLRRPRDGR